jgi:DNA-3-methyladenine glycosylase II
MAIRRISQAGKLKDESAIRDLSRAAVEKGLRHLRERDPIIAEIAAKVGPFRLTTEKDFFKGLVRSILAQQISTSAARSIFARLLKAVEPEGLRPEGILALSDQQFRECGVSPQKIRYLRDFATHVNSGKVRLAEFPLLPNETIIAELVEVKGIGLWTAQMFLIFCLGRLDVFPGDDLGVRTAIKKLYRKRQVPKAKQLRKFEKLWHPYSTIASWYCWRSLEL